MSGKLLNQQKPCREQRYAPTIDQTLRLSPIRKRGAVKRHTQPESSQGSKRQQGIVGGNSCGEYYRDCTKLTLRSEFKPVASWCQSLYEVRTGSGGDRVFATPAFLQARQPGRYRSRF